MKNLFLTILLILPFALPAQIIITVAGNGTEGYSGDNGPATAAELNLPHAVYKSISGYLYIDDENNRLIRKVDAAGIITTICGTGTAGYFGDGGLASGAQITIPADFAMDSIGNLYFPDELNNCIRKIDTAGYISTIIGYGVAGYNGDNILADSAQLNSPTGIAFDKKGNLYICDAMNNRIRKVDTSGIITTIAGTGDTGFSADGSKADTAKLYAIYSIRIDNYGNIFFADNRRIRRIDTAGIITTIAGNGGVGYSGDSGLAINAEIAGDVIALDTIGNIFIADAGNGRIRKVNTAGIITTIAGTGNPGYNGDGGNPLSANLCTPSGIALDANENIYIGDVCNERIREIISDSTNSVTPLISNSHSLTIFPNPSQGTFTVDIASLYNEEATVTITDILGMPQKIFNAITNKQTPINTDLPPGVYFINAITSQQHFTQKLFIL